ncbi:hypothetical protein CTAM01_04218 [Colletotrichum tamarilloi]|uniref:Uncharacterized protein n=1 Tax=Colletotrichum tamarilloi TaxID=1209934 RepID=A0ABQ9RHG8_9PEZI|nr:uncharacterized protein CTAM01_04218 [Colletotrichum tamarilloi]KAI3550795.1 hypothetical protein CSPX01_01290 [Colletotrichum filicis]KAK1503988.1 hypothetical protein CTAM01_04218 [Colletotrichum tamarilloi]
MRGADGPPDNAQEVRPDTRKRRDEKQKRKKILREKKKKKEKGYCSRSGLDALTSFASLRKKKLGGGVHLLFSCSCFFYSFLRVLLFSLFLILDFGFLGFFFWLFFCPK